MPGVDAVYFTVSGPVAPQGVKNTMGVIREFGVRRIVAMSAIGVYNEIPESIGAENNLDSEPEQQPNRLVADAVESSSLDHVILRPGYLEEGDANDYVLTGRKEAAKGHTTPIPALVSVVVGLLTEEMDVPGTNIGITRDGS